MNFIPSMGRMVVSQYIDQPSCFYFAIVTRINRSLHSPDGEGSLCSPSEKHNSRCGREFPIITNCVVGGIKSFSFLQSVIERKLHNVGLPLYGSARVYRPVSGA